MIQLDKVSKIWNPGTEFEQVALHPLSLELYPGELVMVLGSNGSGKSSLLNLLAGTDRTDSGSILLHHRDITQMSEYRRASVVARMFQDPFRGVAADLSLLENMRLAALRGKSHGLRVGTGSAFKALLRTEVAKLDMGLEDRLDTPMRYFSGGQRQALSLLMATWNRPELLLLDEPTAALDPRSAKHVFRLAVDRIAHLGIMALMVSHDLRHALDAGQRVLFFHQGRVLHDVRGADKQALELRTLQDWFSAE